jgi:site-specific DNA-methyltransferase (adenine-specific)
VEALPMAEKELKLYPWDKLQDILPPLSVEEERALKTSIAEQGILQPILILPSGKIVDGVHRWKILKELKPDKEPPKEILSLDDETAFLLGITLNIARRQMTPEQIRELQNNLKKDREMQKKVALELRKKGKTLEEAAAIVGVTHKTVANWEKGEDITICKFTNGYNPRDLRMKLTQKQKEEIIERVASGESQAQVAADYKISQPRVSRIVKKKKENTSQTQIPNELEVKIELGDFLILSKKLADNSIDLILTDPPYPKEYLSLWSDLGAVAQRILRPSGFLIAYSGQDHLPKVLNQLSEYLEYYWLGMLYHKGPTAQRFEVNMWNRAKPILFFYKPPRVKQETWLEDVIESPTPDKDYHKWGQNIEPFKKLLTCFSNPGATILDPFAGGGSVIQAAIETKRNIIAFEKDMNTYQILNERFVQCK